MASPSPCPGTVSCAAERSRKKGSNMRSRSSTGMPGPSSSTDSSNSAAAVMRAEIPIDDPGGEYLAAPRPDLGGSCSGLCCRSNSTISVSRSASRSISAMNSSRVASSHSTSVRRKLETKPLMWLSGSRSSCAVAARISSAAADSDAGCITGDANRVDTSASLRGELRAKQLHLRRQSDKRLRAHPPSVSSADSC